MSAAFFLAMAPLGLMATEVQGPGQLTSNVQDTVTVRNTQPVSSNLVVRVQTRRRAPFRCKKNSVRACLEAFFFLMFRPS